MGERAVGDSIFPKELHCHGSGFLRSNVTALWTKKKVRINLNDSLIVGQPAYVFDLQFGKENSSASEQGVLAGCKIVGTGSVHELYPTRLVF